MTGKQSRRRFLAATGSALGVGLAGCAQAPGRRDTNPDPDDSIDGNPDPGTAGERSIYSRIYADASDSVVSINVFAEGSGQTAGVSSQGSGFMYDDTHVVTNQHVVGGATDVDLRYATGEWVTPEIVGTDAYSDLAVIRVEDPPESAEPIGFVDSEPTIGQEVVAIGNPFGLSGTVSSGIISGIDRTLEGANNFNIADGIQTTAPVNPGNSGGPLVDLDGNAVGVINSGGGDNIAFAISYALTNRVVPALIEDGEYRHTYVGVTLTGVTPNIAEANELDEVDGIILAQVIDDTPADGVLRGSPRNEEVQGVSVPVGGDIIVAMDGTELDTQAELASYLALNTSPGETIDITVLRTIDEDSLERERVTVSLTLGTRPSIDG
ncbi:serine protease [Halobacteriales archaeon SW_7_68_16]|nr:MAG: serine protease [Halobacteriales archaeon SW_7_68_16]